MYCKNIMTEREKHSDKQRDRERKSETKERGEENRELEGEYLKELYWINLCIEWRSWQL